MASLDTLACVFQRYPGLSCQSGVFFVGHAAVTFGRGSAQSRLLRDETSAFRALSPESRRFVGSSPHPSYSVGIGDWRRRQGEVI